MKPVLTEGLSYMDMEGQIVPTLGIDEFKSRLGEDSELMVLNFIVNGQEVGEDLVAWLERGYEWIIDAEISPGEVLDKQFYVFAELKRRSSAPKRIMELLEDLNTLTGIKADEWKVDIDDVKYPASVENMKEHLLLNPSEYQSADESDLNEWREIAGLPSVKKHSVKDEDLLNWQRQAGII